MKSVRPFLLVLAPLILGLFAYWLYWRGEADTFSRQIAEIAGARAEMSGYPYRLSADLNSVSLTRGGEELGLSVGTGPASISRNPVGAGPVVGVARDVEIRVASPGLAMSRLSVSAPRAHVSLRMGGGLVERLSVIADSAEISAPILAGAIHAGPVEFHFRETPTAAPSGNLTGPAQAEARFAGTLSWPGGAVATVSVPVSVTDDTPLRAFSAWRHGGTIEIGGATISGPDGAPFAGFDATLAPLPDGRLALAGTLMTDCPKTALWLFGGGRHPGPEYRRRSPARFAMTGRLAAPVLKEIATPSGGLARNREPPCPDLRR